MPRPNCFTHVGRGFARLRGLDGVQFCACISLAIASLAGANSAFGSDEASRLTSGQRYWTVTDIVQAPEIENLAISVDGKTAAYTVRRGDLQQNKKLTSLFVISLATRQPAKVLEADWVDDLQGVPNSAAFSFRADLGKGVQLYEFAPGGAVVPVVETSVTAAYGAEDISFPQLSYEAPLKEGVLAYGWSPDGKTIWYSTPHSPPSYSGVRINEDAQLLDGYVHGLAELHVRRADGSDIVVGQQPSNYKFGNDVVSWSKDGAALYYKTFQIDAAGRPKTVAQVLNTADGSSSMLDDSLAAKVFVSGPIGPLGGQLEVKGFGAERHLLETQTNGTTRDYGPFAYRMGGFHGERNGRSPNGDVVLSIRDYGFNTHDGLVTLDHGGHLRELKPSASLTACNFTPTFTAGVCVEQSMTTPPALVRVDPIRGSVEKLIELAPDYLSIAPLRVEPRTWTNKYQFMSSGFIVYPRNYVRGRRYPAVLVSHGNDADQSFAYYGFQWEYPVQVWAERGYVVICANDPNIYQSEPLHTAYLQWGSTSQFGVLPRVNRFSTEQMRELLYLSPLDSDEAIVGQLVKEGLVDPTRVGIAGYSRGSNMANVAITHSKLFKAASSGDGGQPNPSGYWYGSEGPKLMNPLFGGSPFDPAAFDNYRKLSPPFRAAEASGPVLQQVQLAAPEEFEFYGALKLAKVPTEIVRYDGETHIFHVPRNRQTAIEQNLDWFDFWLLGKEDPDPAKAEQYARWRNLRDQCAPTVCLKN